MRRITEAEYECWMAIAREYRLADEGGLVPGCFVSDGFEDGVIRLRFITPILASLYSEDLQQKSPPIMFDRSPRGEILLPGRWWQLMFEKLSEDDRAPLDVRRSAAIAARVVDVCDALLPGDTDTIEIEVPDRTGNMVPHEALPPGTVARIRLRPA